MALWERMPDDSFTLTIDANGVITRIDPEVLQVLGYQSIELIGRSFFNLIARGSARHLAVIREAFTGKKPFSCLIVPLVGRGGQVVEASISGLPAAITGHDGGCHMIVHRAAVLRTLEDEEDTVYPHSRLYLELVCHDLNNMLQAEIGYLELAMQSTRPETEVYGYMKRCMSVIESSSSLINNVQKLLRIGTGTGAVEKVDLGRILDESVSHYENIHHRNVTIDYAPVYGCYVMANELLKDVFLNILGNAIQHHPAGSPFITVRVRETTGGGKNEYLICIEDNGPGIPDDLKTKLFNRFQMGDTATSGKGLGLYLVKTLVEGFGGTVCVEDRVPGDYMKGSRFVIALPAAGEPAAQDKAE